MRYYYTSIRMDEIRNSVNTKSRKERGTTVNSDSLPEDTHNGAATSKESSADSYKTQHTLGTQPSSHAGDDGSHESLPSTVYGSFVHNCQNLEAPKIASEVSGQRNCGNTYRQWDVMTP